ITNYMIPNLRAIYELIASAGGYAMFHAEHPNKRWDDMECEYAFFGIFEQIYNLVPGLNMTWEHLSDSRVLPFLLDMDDRVACTICPHHMILRLNDVLGQNHNLCRPPAKTLLYRETLRDAVTSGKSNRILLGLDDAPWKRSDKEGAHGHCGCWTMPAAPQRIVQIFDEDRRLESAQDMTALNSYVAWNAAAYYKLHQTDQVIELVRKPYTIPFAYRLTKDDEVVEVTDASDQRPDDYVPSMAGATLNWSVEASDQD
ncbi:MAG: hypothetical protein KGI45_01200, partial [Patescibacteria group bacterium]|nr:hypothetical protein [Patescibacteria group bacterium]